MGFGLVTKQNFSVYSKYIKKDYLIGVIPGLILAFFGILIIAIWPEFQAQSSEFQKLLEAEIYQVLLGPLAEVRIDTLEGFFAIELFSILEFLMVFYAIFVPSRIITTEIDKNTIDITLSYPIARWKWLSQKYFVYLTNSIIMLIIPLILAYFTLLVINDSMNFNVLFFATFGYFFLFFALGSISLLSATIFLSSGRTLPVSGGIIVGMWILERIFGIVDSLKFLQNISIFHYLAPGNILVNSAIPLDELLVVFIVGIVALIASLLVFENKELVA